ncbi:hypothetical protein ABUV71_000377 [Vibrio vulnificus]
MKTEKTTTIDERNAQIENPLLEKLDWKQQESAPDAQRNIALSDEKYYSILL